MDMSLNNVDIRWQDLNHFITHLYDDGAIMILYKDPEYVPQELK